MTNGRATALRILLITTGLAFIGGVFILMRVWPSGWRWTPAQPEYEQMILAVYATLGLFLLLASRAPSAHRSLILFAGWSSVVHAGIMAVQAVRDVTERGHLFGDVPVLLLLGVALVFLAPGQAEATSAGSVVSGRPAMMAGER